MLKKNIKKSISVLMIIILTLSIIPVNLLNAFAESSIFYEHTLSAVPTAGDNVLGQLTWNFNMAGNGSVETGSSGRGVRFAVAASSSKELIIKTTVNKKITKIVVESAMSAGSDTKLHICVAGNVIADNVPVTSAIAAYTYAVAGIEGEIVISLKATVTSGSAQSYLKSIKLYAEEQEPTPPVNGVFYEHTISTIPTAGNNVLGNRTWHFSMAGSSVETGSTGRGARFFIAENNLKELVIKTTITDKTISRIEIESAMGSGSNTTLSVSIGGTAVATDVPVSNINASYVYNVNDLNGEVVIKLKATAETKASYIKSIALYTGTGSGEKPTKSNYHGHTYRCGHAGTASDEAYVIAALNNDYTIMGFSDHIMLPWISYQNGVRGKYRQAEDYYKSIRALQDKYADQIDILLGYEAEWVIGGLFEDYYRYLIENNIVDYMILGNHWQHFDLNKYAFIAPDENDVNSTPAKQLAHVTQYVTAAKEAFKTGFFSVMAHPEVFFATGYGAVNTFSDEMKVLVKDMCQVAKQYNVALELNHGYIGNMETLPRYTEFWNIVKEVGNTVVIGVDAHDPSAYNENTRKRVIAFAKKIGLTITEDLGITRKTPKNVQPFVVPGIPVENDSTDVAAAKKALTWGQIRGLNLLENSIASDLILPAKINDCTVSWSSSNTAVINNNGIVTRTQNDTDVTLTATIKLGEASETKTFNLKVLSSSKNPDLSISNFLEYPDAWNSATVTASKNNKSVTFTTASSGNYQSTKLILPEAIIIPKTKWKDTYLEFDVTVTGGGIQLVMSYQPDITNTTLVNLGQLMNGDTSSNADHYHGTVKGKLSIQEIVDYINKQPNAGWGPINKIQDDSIIIKQITLWFEKANTTATFNSFQLVNGDNADVDAVIEKIALIPTTITLSDKAKITEARAAYEALTEAKKALVSNLSKLELAETKILELEQTNSNPADNKTTNISGRILDSNGKVMANVVVAIFSDPIFVLTDANGYYTLTNVPVGTHTMRIFKTEEDFLNYVDDIKEGKTPTVKPLVEFENVRFFINASGKSTIEINGKTFEDWKFEVKFNADGTATVNPKTGDNTLIFLLASVAIITCAIVFVVVTRRKRSRMAQI